MTMIAVDAETLLVILGVQLFWSALLVVLRGLAGADNDDCLYEADEKLMLGVMLAPVFSGLVFLALAGLWPPASSPLPLFADMALNGFRRNDGVTVDIVSSAPLFSLPLVAAALYCAGFAAAGCRLVRAHMKMMGVIANAKPGRAGPDRRFANSVKITDETVSPFVSGGVIVLPRILVDKLSAERLALIVAHEQAHMARGDQRYFALLALLDLVFWANPFLRSQTRRCRLAAEIECDRIALRSAPHQRKVYAQTLITTLKHAAGRISPCAPAIFPTRQKGDYRMRVQEIMKISPPSGPRRSRRRVFAFAALAAAPVLAGQFWFAGASANNAPAFSVTPVDGHVSSSYGERRDPISREIKTHRGVDIAAKKGTPVRAPAAGKVVRIQTLDGYGNLMTIDHGGGYVTRYGQLQSFELDVGALVRPGQLIARVGSTGRSTGPHVHFELIRDGDHVDPADYVPMPAKKKK